MKNNLKKILLVSLISLCGTGTALAATVGTPHENTPDGVPHRITTFSSTVTDWTKLAYNQGLNAGQLSGINIYNPNNAVLSSQQVYAWAVAQFPTISSVGKQNLKNQIQQQWMRGEKIGAAQWR